MAAYIARLVQGQAVRLEAVVAQQALQVVQVPHGSLARLEQQRAGVAVVAGAAVPRAQHVLARELDDVRVVRAVVAGPVAVGLQRAGVSSTAESREREQRGSAATGAAAAHGGKALPQ
jgi:hypothetical protein